MRHVRGFTLTIMVFATLVLAGCGGAPNVAVPTPLQTIANPAVQPATVWRNDGGDGALTDANGFQLAIDGGTVYVANAGGDVAAFDLASGNELWRVDTGQRLISGPTAVAGLLLVGTREGDLIALSQAEGASVWSTTVASEVLAPVAANNGIAVAQTVDGRLVAYALDSGNRLWTIERGVPNLTMRGTSSPVIRGDTVYAGLANGHVIALGLDNGRQVWEQSVALPTGRSELERLVDIDADPQIVSGQLFAISIGGKLASLALSSGRIRWKQNVASATGLAISDNRIFTTDLDGVVHAVNRLTGATVWAQPALKYRQLSAPVLYNGYLVVGDYEGYLHWINPRTGELAGRVDILDTAIRQRPVVVDGRLLVLGAGGGIVAVRANPHG